MTDVISIATKICRYSVCDKESKVKGFCSGHYRQWSANEDLRPLRRRRKKVIDIKEHILTNVDIDNESGCWIWKLDINDSGHGAMFYKGSMRPAHKLSFEAWKGIVPDGMHLDHENCISNACCNPDHLRIATPGQNASHRVHMNSNNTSGYRNVHFAKHSKTKPFMVKIRKDGVFLFFGYYVTAEEANEVAIKKRKELFGEFAGLEEPRKVDQ